MKHSYLSTGLQLTSQLFTFFVSGKTNFPKMFSLKNVFLFLLLFDFNVFNIAKCPLLLGSILFDKNSIPVLKFLQNCVGSVDFQSKQFVFHLHKCSNTIKISFVEMSFAKIKLFRFNLHAIALHT